MNSEIDTQSPATLQEQLDEIAQDIKLAEAMKRLQDNQDFKLLFGKEGRFTKDFAMTSMYNLAVFDSQSRVRVHEHLVARSVFLRFIDEIVEEGRMAIDKKAELAAMEE
jgi:hypothetical protein